MRLPRWCEVIVPVVTLLATSLSADDIPDDAPWKVNSPIVTVKKELYKKHPKPRTAALVTVQYVGPKLERMEWHGYETNDDVWDNNQARWSLDNGRTWSEFVDREASTNKNYKGVTVWEGGVCRTFDPTRGMLVEAWLRQIHSSGVFNNFTYIRLSKDLGRTWSEPKQLRYEPGEPFDPNDPLKSSFLKPNQCYPGNNILIHSNGTLIHCVGHAIAPGDPQNERRAWKMAALCFIGKWNAIDDRQPGQGPGLQLSNFSLLENRETHELELHLTTYGQEEDAADWASADNYKYTLTIKPAGEPSAKTSDRGARYDPIEMYTEQSVEGWRVLVHQRLFDDDQVELREQTLKVLGEHLFRVARVVPAESLAKLREVPIWVELAHPRHPCMCYHVSPDWLREHDMNPAKAGAVELANCKNFLAWTIDQPWMVLHELAHAYHHRVLGHDNAEIRTCYRGAMAAKSYDHVLHIRGAQRRHYALNNDQEYFAEATEAYFGTNDFYPFVRAELKQHDPEFYAVIERLWGVRKPDAAPPPSR